MCCPRHLLTRRSDAEHPSGSIPIRGRQRGAGMPLVKQRKRPARWRCSSTLLRPRACRGFAETASPGCDAPGESFRAGSLPFRSLEISSSPPVARELRRRSAGSISGVYFRIPDEEAVWVGHYGQAHRWMTAAQAVCEFSSAEDARGWEVVIPRRIQADELHAVREVPRRGLAVYTDGEGQAALLHVPILHRGDRTELVAAARLPGSPDD